MNLNFGSRIWLYGPIALGLIVLIAWHGLWRAATHTIQSETDKAFAQLGPGVSARYDDFSRKGFPFIFRGAFNDVEFQGPDFAYSTPTIFVDALPYDLSRVIFTAADSQRLTIGGAEIDLNAPDAKASVEKDDSRGWLFKLSGGDAPIVGVSQTASVETARFLLNAGPPLGATAQPPGAMHEIDASLVAETMQIAVGGQTGTIDRLELAMLTRAPKALFDDRFATSGPLAPPEIDVNRLAVTIGRSSLTVRGAITFDAQGRANGRLNTRIESPTDLATFLYDASVLNRQEADALMGAMTLAALAGGGAVNTTIILDKGDVRLLGVRVGKAPRLRLPNR